MHEIVYCNTSVLCVKNMAVFIFWKVVVFSDRLKNVRKISALSIWLESHSICLATHWWLWVTFDAIYQLSLLATCMWFGRCLTTPPLLCCRVECPIFPFRWANHYTFKTIFILLVLNSQPCKICHLPGEPGLHCDHDFKQQTDKRGSGRTLTAQQPVRATGSGTSSSTEWSQSTDRSQSGDSESDQNHSPNHGASGHDADEPGWYVIKPTLPIRPQCF